MHAWFAVSRGHKVSSNDIQSKRKTGSGCLAQAFYAADRSWDTKKGS